MPFLDTAFLSAGDPSLWLPGDGHFSAAGARRTAALVTAHLRRDRLATAAASATDQP